jgi:hypothetical protein
MKRGQADQAQQMEQEDKQKRNRAPSKQAHTHRGQARYKCKQNADGSIQTGSGQQQQWRRQRQQEQQQQQQQQQRQQGQQRLLQAAAAGSSSGGGGGGGSRSSIITKRRCGRVGRDVEGNSRGGSAIMKTADNNATRGGASEEIHFASSHL